MAVAQVTEALSLHNRCRDEADREAKDLETANKRHTSLADELAETEKEITDRCKRLSEIYNGKPPQAPYTSSRP